MEGEKLRALNVPRSLFVPRIFVLPEAKPLKRIRKGRRIIKHRPSVSLIDLPSLALFNILSRLSLDDIFINLLLVSKFVKNVITELVLEHRDYFTKSYRDNYLGTYLMGTKLVLLPDHKYFGTYMLGELIRSEEEQLRVFDSNEVKYVIGTTRYTQQNMTSLVGNIKMVHYTSQGKGGRGIIVSCNGILCLRLMENAGFIVTNPMFRYNDEDVAISEPRYRIYDISGDDSNPNNKRQVKQMGSGIGFGCTRGNSNKFKVLVVKNYLYTSDSLYDFYYYLYPNDCNPIINIGIDNHQPCVKATCEILTIGIDSYWRVLPEQDCWFWCCHSHTFVTFHGYFFWIGHCSRNDATPGLYLASRCVCVAFDIEVEKAIAIELPPTFTHLDDYFGGLVILGKNLCLFDNVSCHRITIWKMAMERRIEDSIWSVEFIINKCTLVAGPKSQAYKSLFAPVAKMSTGEIIMFCRYHRVVCLYNPITKQIPYYIGDIGATRAMDDQVMPFTPNFAPLKDIIRRGIDQDT